MYECSCGKQYKRLRPFHVHRASCELLRLSKKSNQDISHLSDLPSQQEMWLALQTALVQIDTLKILQTLLTAQLIPLSLGMTIQYVRPKWAEKLLQFVPKLGRIGVVLTLTLITATQAQQIIGLGVLPHLTALVSILVCLLIGDVMMRGEAAEIRRSLAISTAIRNVALAFLIVGTNFPGTPAVTIAFVFGLYSLIVGFTYGKLMSGSDVQSAEA